LRKFAVESGELNKLVENLHYSAERLIQIWPGRFPDLNSAQPYAGDPEKLANFVYANRLGNGAPAVGDGWAFRGRGIMQITGRSNYRDVGKNLGLLSLESQPDLLAEPPAAALSAAFFWKTKGLNELADRQTDDSFKSITSIINGALTSLDDRRNYWQTAKRILSVA